MKRGLGVLLVVMLLTAPAFAEDVDLTAMSLGELHALSFRIIDEIESRFPFDSSPFGSGLYVGGKSIKPGQYIFTCTGAFYTRNDNTRADMGSVTIWANEEQYIKGYSSRIINVDVQVGQTVSLIVEEGTVVEIEYASGTIQPASAVWAP